MATCGTYKPLYAFEDFILNPEISIRKWSPENITLMLDLNPTLPRKKFRPDVQLDSILLERNGDLYIEIRYGARYSPKYVEKTTLIPLETILNYIKKAEVYTYAWPDDKTVIKNIASDKEAKKAKTDLINKYSNMEVKKAYVQTENYDICIWLPGTMFPWSFSVENKQTGEKEEETHKIIKELKSLPFESQYVKKLLELIDGDTKFEKSLPKLSERSIRLLSAVKARIKTAYKKSNYDELKKEIKAFYAVLSKESKIKSPDTAVADCPCNSFFLILGYYNKKDSRINIYIPDRGSHTFERFFETIVHEWLHHWEWCLYHEIEEGKHFHARLEAMLKLLK